MKIKKINKEVYRMEVTIPQMLKWLNQLIQIKLHKKDMIWVKLRKISSSSKCMLILMTQKRI